MTFAISCHDDPRQAGPLLGLSPCWWLAYVVFVIYGSLVPLDYRPLPLGSAWQEFGRIRLLDVGAGGRADWVANGVLYVPVGFLTASLLAGRGRGARWGAALGGLGFVVILAVVVEFVQLFFPPRTVSLNDLSAELVGGGLGVAVATLAGDRLGRLVAAWAGGVERFAPRLLPLYALAYFAFSFFPFDFLLSGGELANKLASDGWGWLWAGSGGRGGAVAGAAKLFAEALAAVPLGWLLASRGVGIGRALAAGAGLGVAIELGQFFLVSGVSQGFSALTRAAGVAVGAWLWTTRGRLDPLVVAAAIRQYGGIVVTAYLLALVAVTGWFELSWRGWPDAALALQEVRFLPFYYHYFTTEQAALLSLTSVCLMFSPVGVLAWAFFVGPRMAAVLASLLAAMLEGSKLFLVDLHPDPTNLLLAAVAAWAACRIAEGAQSLALRVAQGQGVPGGDVAPNGLEAASRGVTRLARPRRSQARRSNPKVASSLVDEHAIVAWPAVPGSDSVHAEAASGAPWSTPRAPMLLGLLAALTVVAWGVATFPLQPVLLGLALAGYAGVLWAWPGRMWVAVPVALPLLDLAPWSGRFFFDEFDLLLLVTVVVGYARLAPAPKADRDWPARVAVGLVALSFGIATLRGMFPWQGADGQAFSHYYSPFNALRLAKGVVWAFLVAALARRCAAAGMDVPREFGKGLVLGLAGTVAVVIWERWAFPGLLNFTDVYRVTGPFSQMHTGGADLEAYLVVAVPFLVAALGERRRWLERGLGVLLLMASTYAVMVTFSRAGYLGFSVAVAVTVGFALTGTWGRSRSHFGRLKGGAGAVALLALVAAVAAPVFLGGFAQERLARAGQDLGARVAHWRDALAMRDPGLTTALVGTGLGRFPSVHYWRSGEVRAAGYQIGRDGDNQFLRLGTGSPLYVEQFVGVQPGQTYTLSLRARSPAGAGQVAVSLCEKWLLTSGRCVFAGEEMKSRGWQLLTLPLATGEVGGGPWYEARPVKLSLYNAGQGAAVEVDDLRLVAGDGRDLLANGNFSAGMDRWFFSVDVDLPWHVWSLPVAVLFELGWAGIVALGVAVPLAIWRAGSPAAGGSSLAGAWLGALLGLGVLGIVDSLVDSPRLLFLGLFIFVGSLRLNTLVQRN